MNIRCFCVALLIIGLAACAGAEADETGRVPPDRRDETAADPPLKADPEVKDVTFATTDIVIETAAGARYPFVVEVADTAEQRRRGLMYRQSLPEDGGMIFLFDEPRIAAFWMKNTFVSLDMLFLTRDGRIVDYHERAQPGKWREDGYLAIIQSKVPVSAVLEVVAGTVERLDLALGDRVLHPFFEVR